MAADKPSTFSCMQSCSPLFLSLCWNGHFSRCNCVSQYQNVAILDFIGTKNDAGSDDNWSCKTCKATVRLLPPTNQHPVSLQAGCHSGRPTKIIITLKGMQHSTMKKFKTFITVNMLMMEQFNAVICNRFRLATCQVQWCYMKVTVLLLDTCLVTYWNQEFMRDSRSPNISLWSVTDTVVIWLFRSPNWKCEGGEL